jgi:hypothetical protein
MVEINGNDFCNFTKSANHYCFLSSFYICNCCVAGWTTTTLFFLINDSSHSLGERERERERERAYPSIFEYFLNDAKNKMKPVLLIVIIYFQHYVKFSNNSVDLHESKQKHVSKGMPHQTRERKKINKMVLYSRNQITKWGMGILHYVMYC